MFAENLKTLRKSKGLTQVQFAEIFNISSGTIAMWETNKRVPDTSMLIKIAEFFNVTVDYLLGKTVNENKPSPVPVQNESRFGPETQKVINELLAKLRAMPDTKQEEAARGALTYVRGVVSADEQEGKA